MKHVPTFGYPACSPKIERAGQGRRVGSPPFMTAPVAGQITFPKALSRWPRLLLRSPA
jgi:hypothetical protein